MINVLALFGMLSVGLAWLVPAHFLPWMSWHSEVPAFFGVILLAGCGWQRMRQNQVIAGIALPRAVIPFAALAIIAFAQRLNGQIPFWGNVWTLWLYMSMCILGLTFCGAALAGLQSPRKTDGGQDHLASFALVLFVFAAIATAVSLVQVLSLWEDSGWIVRMTDIRRPGGNLAQPNHLATVQAMGIASALYLLSRRKLSTLSFTVALGYLATGIAITESRSGALSIIVLSLWCLRMPFRSTAQRGGLASMIAFFSLSIFVVWPHVLNAMLLTEDAATNLTSSSRSVVWQQLLAALAIHPWQGWGIGGVAKALNAVASDYVVSSPFTYSHNIFLDLALWLGIPVALALIVPCIIWLKRRTARAETPQQWYAAAISAPLVVHSMFEFPFAYGYLLAPPLVVLGFVAYGSAARPLLRVSPSVAACILVASSALMALSVKEYLLLNEEFTRARFESARIGMPAHPSEEPRIFLFTQLTAVTRAAKWTPERNVSAETLDLLRTVALQYPWIATQYRYALALALSGQMPEAERQFKVMRAQHGALKFSAVRAAIDDLAAGPLPELTQLKLPN